jgi:C-5 cytosine-specific DNA methylase
MGFPDTFTWDHNTQSPKDMYRQIGNAVAVPVGCALGRELLKVLIDKWEKEKEAVSFRDGDVEQVWELGENDDEDTDERQSMNMEVPDLVEDVEDLDLLGPATENGRRSRAVRHDDSEGDDGGWMRID